MKPSVTIAIPTRNRPQFLRAALASALAAAGPDDQVVVSDNASTDETAGLLAAIADPRATVIRHSSDLGMVGNWNTCLGAARGEYFLLLSDDDLVTPDAVALLAPTLADPLVAFAYGRTQVVDEQGRERTLGHLGPVRERGDALVKAWLRFERTIYPCAAMFRTADLRAQGGYRDAFGPFADAGAWLGVVATDRARTVSFVPNVVASYRAHEAALSTTGLDAGVKGLAQLAAIHGAAYGESADRGFERMGAHFVASALRRRARGATFPLIAYAGLVLRHLPLVVRHGAPEPYWRQALILANPAAYERRKRRRAAAVSEIR